MNSFDITQLKQSDLNFIDYFVNRTSTTKRVSYEIGSINFSEGTRLRYLEEFSKLLIKLEASPDISRIYETMRNGNSDKREVSGAQKHLKEISEIFTKRESEIFQVYERAKAEAINRDEIVDTLRYSLPKGRVEVSSARNLMYRLMGRSDLEVTFYNPQKYGPSISLFEQDLTISKIVGFNEVRELSAEVDFKNSTVSLGKINISIVNSPEKLREQEKKLFKKVGLSEIPLREIFYVS